MCPLGPPQIQCTFNSYLNYLNLKTVWALNSAKLSRWGAWSWDLCPLACKPWLEHWYYVLHEQEKIFSYNQRIRQVKASIFTPPSLSTGIWEEPPQSSAPHVEWRETAWQQKMGWICFYLRFALLNPQMCLSGATSFAIIPGNVACVSQLISVRTSKHKWYKFYKHSRYIYYTQDFFIKLICLHLIVNWNVYFTNASVAPYSYHHQKSMFHWLAIE